MSEEKKTPSEGRLILELEKLLDSLPDDAARQRVLEWAQNRWGSTKTGGEPVKAAPTQWLRSQPVPFWPGEPYAPPLTITGASTRKCAFEGLPDGVYGMVCFCPKCSPQCMVVNTDGWRGFELLLNDRRMIGPGAPLPGGVFRS